MQWARTILLASLCLAPLSITVADERKEAEEIRIRVDSRYKIRANYAIVADVHSKADRDKEAKENADEHGVKLGYRVYSLGKLEIALLLRLIP